MRMQLLRIFIETKVFIRPSKDSHHHIYCDEWLQLRKGMTVCHPGHWLGLSGLLCPCNSLPQTLSTALSSSWNNPTAFNLALESFAVWVLCTFETLFFTLHLHLFFQPYWPRFKGHYHLCSANTMTLNSFFMPSSSVVLYYKSTFMKRSHLTVR